jgi:hypothetical protein
MSAAAAGRVGINAVASTSEPSGSPTYQSIKRKPFGTGHDNNREIKL